jgi:homoserine dehydrogenase
MRKLTLGLFGYGVVGKGLVDLINDSSETNIEIKKICIRQADKKRNLDCNYFTTNKDDLLKDPEINIIVELIDDADAALLIVKEAFSAGKAVVSANKKMIAENLQLLLDWQKEYKLPFLYEASCCAGIPIIRNLEEYYTNNSLNSVEGILNGSSNYILSQLINYNKTFDEALIEAQEKGFAETDPSLDIDAIDPKYKLGILIFHAFGLVTEPEQLFNYGIRKLNHFDISFAKKRGKKIRLIAKCKREKKSIQAWCAPSLVDEGSILSSTENELNAVILEGAFAEQQSLIGKGAGDYATGSAVLSDISALENNYKYQYKKNKLQTLPSLDSEFYHSIYVRYNNDSEPNFNDFTKINERYDGEKTNYIIATIKHETLQQAKWLNEPEINILLLN